MKSRPNILFSSTSQWNVGDEFILRGLLNALGRTGITYNSVLFNRNPIVSTPWNPIFAYPSKPDIPWENSSQLLASEPIDYVIFAGSPEWAAGVRSPRLHRFIIEKRLRCAFLGTGLGEIRDLSGDIVTVLREHTDAFVSRDLNAFETVKSHIAPHRHSCPAILSCQTESTPQSPPVRIGFSIQASKGQLHSIPAETCDYMLREYKSLAANYSVVGIAHYIDDLYLADEMGIDCRYSYSAQDYEAIYKDFDLIITTRVHGAGIAASLGIPSILVAHDGRADTGIGFGAMIIQPGVPLLPLLQETDWKKRANKVLELKRQSLEFYPKIIRSLSFACTAQGGDITNG